MREKRDVDGARESRGARTGERGDGETAERDDGARGRRRGDDEIVVDVACKQGKTTSRLSIADEEEFPALASGARRNLAMALDGTSRRRRRRTTAARGADVDVRRRRARVRADWVSPRAGANGAARRIAPTMVSRRVETMDGTGTNASAFASAPARGEASSGRVARVDDEARASATDGVDAVRSRSERP